MTIRLHWFLPTGGDSRDVLATEPDAHRREHVRSRLHRGGLVTPDPETASKVPYRAVSAAR